MISDFKKHKKIESSFYAVSKIDKLPVMSTFQFEHNNLNFNFYNSLKEKDKNIKRITFFNKFLLKIQNNNRKIRKTFI